MDVKIELKFFLWINEPEGFLRTLSLWELILFGLSIYYIIFETKIKIVYFFYVIGLIDSW